MSILSSHCLGYPTTAKDISLLKHRVFGTQCVILQEKTKIFKSRFHPFYIEFLQDYQHKVMKKHMNKKHGLLRMYSLKDGDTSGVHTSKFDEYKHLLGNIYVFLRPYAMLGSILQLSSILVLPLNSMAQVTPYFLLEWLKAIVPFLFIYIFNVAVNQIFDLEIDKVNKPLLPLVSGGVSKNFVMTITVASLIMGLGLGIKFGSPASSTALAFLVLIFGVLYSVDLPYMRWKRNPFLAAFCNVFPNAITTNLAYFIHMQKYVLGEPVVLSRTIIFAVAGNLVLGCVIAMFKDIPDVDGDKLHGIKTFSIIYGPQRVFWLCIGVLMMGYGGAMAIGIYSSSLTNKIVAVLGHFSLAFIVLNKAPRVDVTDKKDTQAFYMFIWKLIYMEYLLIPFMR